MVPEYRRFQLFQVRLFVFLGCRGGIFPDFLQGDQFAVMFGNDAQAGGTAVFRVGLFVEGESGFQEKDCLNLIIFFS